VVRWEVWVHKTSLPSPIVFFNWGAYTRPLSTIFDWMLELFRQGGIFLFFVLIHLLILIEILFWQEEMVVFKIETKYEVYSYTISCGWCDCFQRRRKTYVRIVILEHTPVIIKQLVISNKTSTIHIFAERYDLVFWICSPNRITYGSRNLVSLHTNITHCYHE
jgi:hypothetical protein